jgi:3-methyladenine DNA glycosylase AlkD
MSTGALHREIVADLLKHKGPTHQQSRYNKQPGYVSYGIKTPLFLSIIKAYKKQIEGLPERDAFALALDFYESGIEEQMYVGNHILVLHIASITPKRFGFLDRCLSYFKSWGTTDDFCIHVMQHILSRYPSETYALLRKWNRSGHIWKRRASVVTFTRRAGASGEHTNVALELCENLVNDKEDLIRKAVGWALKDTMCGDKEKVLGYVAQLRKRGTSAVITLYALRDITGREREQILKKK